MWIFTKYGFFSVVRATPAPGTQDFVVVRARAQDDLERLLAWVDALPDDYELKDSRAAHIVSTPMRDYPFRIVIPADDFALLAMLLAEDIDYENFKDAVGKRHSKPRATLYSQVWAAMHPLYKPALLEPRGKKR